MTTLTCSAVRKHYKLHCSSLAVWAVKRRDGDQWHGACHQHPHQVMKRVRGEGGELVVMDAVEAMEENDRLRAVHRAAEEREHLLDRLREVVLDTDEPWDSARALAALRAEGYVLGEAWGPALLVALEKERVLEEKEAGSYVCIAHLPR